MLKDHKINKKKRVAILGSTGSIGVNTLDVLSHLKDEFEVVALTAGRNISLLEKQIRNFSPKYVAIDEAFIDAFKKKCSFKKTIKLMTTQEGLSFIAGACDVDIVVIALTGSLALDPFLSAVQAGKIIAPANKEALIVAGQLLMKMAKETQAVIIPIDSEQSAIFQCLKGIEKKDVSKVYLTASGGSLLHVPFKKFDALSVKDILRHPRWRMGKKITVDCATLMNKGFEVIEAMRLFDVSIEQIKVVVHPQSIIHSMVETIDGSILAQLSVPDMRIPIQYALTYPRRLMTPVKKINFITLGQMNFLEPDLKKFPSLKLAYDVAKKGGTLPAVLNASDEVAVESFLNGKIKFTDIYRFVEKTISHHTAQKDITLSNIKQADSWAREYCKNAIHRVYGKDKA